jgi:hypothetical protein
MRAGRAARRPLTVERVVASARRAHAFAFTGNPRATHIPRQTLPHFNADSRRG